MHDYMTTWTRELGRDINQSQWASAFYYTQSQCASSFDYTHKLSISGYSQDKNFKILTKWYKVSVQLHTMFLDASDQCWCCHQTPGSFLHIWRECATIRNLWNKVAAVYSEINGTPPFINPLTCFALYVPRLQGESTFLCFGFFPPGRMQAYSITLENFPRTEAVNMSQCPPQPPTYGGSESCRS